MVGIPSWLKSIVVTALLVAIILLFSFVLKFGVTPSADQGAWGQFGDFVGGILNPLFSIIGLLALLYTIVLQSEELRRSTRELKSSAKALKRQNRHNARQQFDANFFQLLNIHRELTDRLTSDNKSGVKVIESKIFHLGWAYEPETGSAFWVHEWSNLSYSLQTDSGEKRLPLAEASRESFYNEAILKMQDSHPEWQPLKV